MEKVHVTHRHHHERRQGRSAQESLACRHGCLLTLSGCIGLLYSSTDNQVDDRATACVKRRCRCRAAPCAATPRTKLARRQGGVCHFAMVDLRALCDTESWVKRESGMLGLHHSPTWPTLWDGRSACRSQAEPRRRRVTAARLLVADYSLARSQLCTSRASK